VKADLATSQGRAAFVDGVTALLVERLDAVIACAGVALPTPLTLKVNYFGAVATLEELRPLLATREFASCGRHFLVRFDYAG
jgi:hypothetical protein